MWKVLTIMNITCYRKLQTLFCLLIACQHGFIRPNGTSCVPCGENRYGRQCLQNCSCSIFQRYYFLKPKNIYFYPMCANDFFLINLIIELNTFIDWHVGDTYYGKIVAKSSSLAFILIINVQRYVVYQSWANTSLILDVHNNANKWPSAWWIWHLLYMNMLYHNFWPNAGHSSSIPTN